LTALPKSGYWAKDPPWPGFETGFGKNDPARFFSKSKAAVSKLKF
jgi:hypothetical protein